MLDNDVTTGVEDVLDCCGVTRGVEEVVDCCGVTTGVKEVVDSRSVATGIEVIVECCGVTTGIKEVVDCCGVTTGVEVIDSSGVPWGVVVHVADESCGVTILVNGGCKKVEGVSISVDVTDKFSIIDVVLLSSCRHSFGSRKSEKSDDCGHSKSGGGDDDDGTGSDVG